MEVNYLKLVNAAKNIHDDKHDLVHHTYLRILRLEGVDLLKVMKYPFAYFTRSMFMEGTRGKFKKDYTLIDHKPKRILIADYDMSHAFLLENFQLAADRLSWFDKTVLNLYCDGYNLTEVAKQSGINPTTFWTSIHRSKIKLKVHFNEKTVF
tara:strand:- start:835 stop:1290 length:456 start_codon:yes stop_codon:yes gene_type:complete